jgi:predicted transposase YbfD/YdcC
MDLITQCFSRVEDPRAPNAQHPLLEIVLIMIAGVVSGCETATEWADFGRAKEAWLRRFLELRHGVPSHDTFSRVLRLIDPEAFELAFAKFASAFGEQLSGVIAIDGKALSGAYERGAQASPLHIVNVWGAEARMALAQVKAPGRNEIAGALEALEMIALNADCIVTGDALYCRPDIMRAIRKKKAEYVLAVKANRPKLKALAEAALRKRNVKTRRTKPVKAHDRVESFTVKTTVIPGLEALTGLPGARACASVTCTRKRHGRKPEPHTRLFVMSCRLSPGKLLKAVHEHWGVENGLHWVMDVAFKEDDCRSRKDNAPNNLAIIRKIAFNLIQKHPEKISVRRKLKRAALDDDFRDQLFAQMR